MQYDYSNLSFLERKTLVNYRHSKEEIARKAFFHNSSFDFESHLGEIDQKIVNEVKNYFNSCPEKFPKALIYNLNFCVSYEQAVKELKLSKLAENKILFLASYSGDSVISCFPKEIIFEILKIGIKLDCHFLRVEKFLCQVYKEKNLQDPDFLQEAKKQMFSSHYDRKISEIIIFDDNEKKAPCSIQ